MDLKAVIRRAFDFIDEGDMAEAGKLFAPNAYWLFPGLNALGGEYLGRDAIVDDLLPKLSALSSGAINRVALLDVSEGENHSFALQSLEATRDGRSVSTTVCHVLTFREGLIQGVYSYPFDADALGAFRAGDDGNLAEVVAS